MIVPYDDDDDDDSVSVTSSYKDIVKYKKRRKHKLSYFELVELQKLQYRNARLPRRIREVRPLTPPEIVEEESSAKPVHRWIPKKQKVCFFFSFFPFSLFLFSFFPYLFCDILYDLSICGTFFSSIRYLKLL